MVKEWKRNRVPNPTVSNTVGEKDEREREREREREEREREEREREERERERERRVACPSRGSEDVCALVTRN